MSLNPSKAIGPNSIPTKILTLLINVSSQLTELFFNLPFSCGVFQLIYKTSKVLPVYQKNSKLKCSKYRPISLLSTIDKVLGRLMYNHLYNLLEMSSGNYDLRFGLRYKYSTTDALIHLTDKIRKQLDIGNFSCKIFIDLQKAFDMVAHDILTQKLNHYGIRGVANNWFSSYLPNRLQHVSINGFNFNLEHIRGSVLGPLSFLIYINDLNHPIRYCCYMGIDL